MSSKVSRQAFLLSTDSSILVSLGMRSCDGDLILSCITDQTLCIGECNVRRLRSLSLIISNDLNAIMLPYTHA